ncbi:flagellar protein FliS [Bryobacterales bacterium F-183]|nr:flagellar protein FliS [Bryobacterales bacterium F-183]
MHQIAYLESEVLSASPIRLIELLYRGAIDATAAAKVAAEQGNALERSRHLSRAHAILVELSRSLDHTVGGQLSRDLVELYDYMQRQLTHANLSQEIQPISDVYSVLTNLLEAWQQVSSVASGAPSRQNIGGYYGAGQIGSVDLEVPRVNSLG